MEKLDLIHDKTVKFTESILSIQVLADKLKALMNSEPHLSGFSQQYVQVEIATTMEILDFKYKQLGEELIK